jgi:hypothetical protein
MGGVFISYRREDSQGEALHLFEDLKEHFGKNRLFMDVTGIDPGNDFRKVIENAVNSWDVLIVMIGKRWIDAIDEKGKRRLDDPKDFVRIETTAALHLDVPVIPVLVQGAGMPRPDQLPAEIEALAWRHAFELRHNGWGIDVAELVTALRKVLPESSTVSSAQSKPRRLWSTIPWSLASAGATIGIVTGLAVAIQQAGTFAYSIKQNVTSENAPIKSPPYPILNVLSFRDWEGYWNLKWEWAGKWYETTMQLNSSQFGITADYGFGTLEGAFVNGDITKVTGQYTNNYITVKACASGKQGGSFSLTLEYDGRSMSGWWDLCGDGNNMAWKADKRDGL